MRNHFFSSLVLFCLIFPASTSYAGITFLSQGASVNASAYYFDPFGRDSDTDSDSDNHTGTGLFSIRASVNVFGGSANSNVFVSTFSETEIVINSITAGFGVIGDGGADGNSYHHISFLLSSPYEIIFSGELSGFLGTVNFELQKGNEKIVEYTNNTIDVITVNESFILEPGNYTLIDETRINDGFGVGSFSMTINAVAIVPEPVTFISAIFGIIGLLFFRPPPEIRYFLDY